MDDPCLASLSAPRHDGLRKRAGAAADIELIKTFRRLEPIKKQRRDPPAPPAHTGIVALARLPRIIMPG
jgi:hypothetical protein